MGLQIGKKAGTGHFGSIRIPSSIIIWARKTLFVEKMRSMVPCNEEQRTVVSSSSRDFGLD